MKTIGVSLFYNEANPLAARFVDSFAADFKKCMQRFRLPVSLHVNSLQPADYTLVVLAADDIENQSYADSSKLLLHSNAMLLSITPVDLSPLNELVTKHPFLFWDKQADTGELRLIHPNSKELIALYWQKVTDIVAAINELEVTKTLSVQRQYVYVTVDDISHSADRESIIRDLNELGYEVLPNKPLSDDITLCTQQVKELVGQASLILVIVPPIYNIAFRNEQLSLTEHQCNVISEYLATSAKDVHRIIWIPSTYDITDEVNQAFIERIQRDRAHTVKSTVLKSSMEDLKKMYHQKLSATGASSAQLLSSARVYIIHDHSSQGLEVEASSIFPDSILSYGVTYSKHLEMLAKAEVAIVCYSGENEKWLEVKANDILKSKGVSLAIPFSKVILYKRNGTNNTSVEGNIFTSVVHSKEALMALNQ